MLLNKNYNATGHKNNTIQSSFTCATIMSKCTAQRRGDDKKDKKE